LTESGSSLSGGKSGEERRMNKMEIVFRDVNFPYKRVTSVLLSASPVSAVSQNNQLKIIHTKEAYFGVMYSALLQSYFGWRTLVSYIPPKY
jgi:hypothetical protein